MRGMNATTQGLAQEIIDLILDKVAFQTTDHEQRMATLLACSLVCRAFHSRSRRHALAHLRFTLDSLGDERALKLSKVIEKHPDLILGIQSMDFIIPLLTDAENHSFNLTTGVISGLYRKMKRSVSHTSHLNQIGLRALLNSLDQAESLQTLSVIGPKNGHRWDAQLSTYFLDLLSKHPVTSICIANMRRVPRFIFQSVLTASASLQQVRLSDVSFEFFGQANSWGDIVSGSRSSVQQLEVLTFLPGDLIQLVQNCCSTPAFPRLRRLIVSIPFQDLSSQLGNFLQCEMPRIEVLELDGTDVALAYLNRSIVQPSFLSYLPTLRTLKIILQVPSLTNSGFHGILRHLAVLFGREVSANRITEIEVDIHRVSGASQEGFLSSQPGWSSLDQALTGPAYPELQTFNFKLKSLYHGRLRRSFPITANYEVNTTKVLPLTSVACRHCKVNFELVTELPEHRNCAGPSY